MSRAERLALDGMSPFSDSSCLVNQVASQAERLAGSRAAKERRYSSRSAAVPASGLLTMAIEGVQISSVVFHLPLESFRTDDAAVQMLARNMIYLRKVRKLSQQQAAARARVDEKTWCKIENAKRLSRNWHYIDDQKFAPVSPDIATIEKVAYALGVSVRLLFERELKGDSVSMVLVPQASRRLRSVIAETVRSRRITKKLSQEEAAERAGIAVRTWQRIESAATSLSMQTLCDLADALDVTVADLLE